MPKLLTLLVIITILAGPGSAQALVKFDFEQKYFVEFGEEIKDHCLIREGTTYHLFYLRGNPAVNIGHAISEDLIHWTIEPPVLSIDPTAWDNLAMWAPQIIQDHRGYYVMYYTGVNTSLAQQAGIAVSADLYQWMKLSDPVYHPDPSWALWDESTFSHGRDPFVFEHESFFYMLNTAKTWWDRGAISAARSSDRYVWEETDPLYINDSWHVLESVQLIERAGKFHLFFTEEAVNGTTHMTSDSLFGSWDHGSKRIVDLGHAPEINEFDEGEYVFSRHSIHQYNDGSTQFVILLDELAWAGDLPFVVRPWPLHNDWTLVHGNAFVYQPTFLNNPAARGEDVDVGFEGASWIGTLERYQGPLGVGLSGFAQGDGKVGAIRSKTFQIVGNSMNLLVGGGDYPDDCYVALIDATSQEILFKETGRNTDEMDRRYWDLSDYHGIDAYIEIVDNSAATFGHISCDDITESYEIIDPAPPPPGDGDGDRDKEPPMSFADVRTAAPVLFQNSPNPFNPTTTISYFLPEKGRVTLDIFDVSGKRVRRLVSGEGAQGSHNATWDGKNGHGVHLPTGVYFYRLLVNDTLADTKKMILLK